MIHPDYTNWLWDVAKFVAKMDTSNNADRLTAREVLRRYIDERLPSFVDVDLEDVNQVGRFGERPLHLACSRGKLEEVAALVEGGAGVNANGELGNTPLHEAVGQNHIEVIKYLLDHGALSLKSNELGDTPIDVARLGGRHDIVELLAKQDLKG